MNPTRAFLDGGGAMGARMRAHDWASSGLGEPEAWPAALRTSVRLMLTTGHPVFIFWGPEHICLYNDAYSTSLGPEKHPAMLGARGREVWPEIWHIIGPQIDQVMSGGAATWHENQLVPIVRHGRLEEVYWTYSYSPIDSEGAVGGVLVICTETTERVVAERTSAAALDHLTELLQQTPSFVAILSGPEHVFEFVNDAYQALIGPRRILGLPVREALPDIAGQGFYDLLDGVYKSGETYVGRSVKVTLARIADAPAEDFLLDFVYKPVRAQDGGIIGIFVEGYDVTERVRAESALAQKVGELAAILDAVPAAIWIARDFAAQHIDGNAFAHRVLRTNVGANLSLSADPSVRPMGFCVLDKDGRALAADDLPVQRAARGEVIENFEEEVVFDDGASIVMLGSARPLLDDAGRPRGAVAAFADITERRKAERALADLNRTLEQRVADALAEKSLLAQIVESAEAFVQVADLEYRWLAINRAAADEFERIYGVRPSVGKSMLDILADRPDHRAAVRDAWRPAIELGQDYVAVEEFGDRSLDRRYYEMRFSALRDAEGRHIGAYQFVYDVTERLRNQAKLAEAEAALHQAQKMEAVGQLTGGVAHDFNNLLAVVTGGLQLLERPLDAAKRTQVMNGMRRAVDRGATLTRQLLAFSRKRPLNVAVIDVAAQIVGMRDLLDRILGADITFELDFGNGEWPIEVDPSELELAILNLCVNSRDAMPGGGELVISARQTELGEGARVVIVVADTGVGMSEETRARVFEPFFTTKEVGKGSGLGLAQVYAFAQRSGGEVRIESAPGQGARISLTLPCAQKPVARTVADASAAEPIAAGETKARILLVEDDSDVAMITEAVLRELGHEVHVVHRAEDALSYLVERTGDIDLMVSDIQMPGMNGIVLKEAVAVRWPGLPVILMTGHPGRARGGEVEALLKPLAAPVLAQAIQKCLAMRERASVEAR